VRSFHSHLPSDRGRLKEFWKSAPLLIENPQLPMRVEARPPNCSKPTSPASIRTEAEVSSGTTRVVTETTPARAEAPYIDEAGPRRISMRSMSSSEMGSACHVTWPSSSCMQSRPSISSW
jgi:hypothetical protein